MRLQQRILLALVPATTLPFWTAAPDAVGLPKATFLWLLAVALSGLGAFRLAKERVLRVPRGPLAPAVGGFLVALLLSWSVSDTRMLSFVGEYTRYSGLATYLSAVVVCLTAARVLTPGDVRAVVRCIVLTLAVVVAYGLVQLVDIDPVTWKEQGFGPVFSTLGNSNFLAGFLGVTAPAAIWLALTEGRRSWMGSAAALVAVGAVIVAAGSRSFQGPLTLGTSLAFFGLLASVGQRDVVRLRLSSWSSASRAAALGGSAFVVLFALVALALTLPGAIDSGLVERRSFWGAAVDMFRDAPVIGQGLDSYGQLFLRYRSSSHATDFLFNHAEAAHSVPLNLLAGGGVVLLGTWLAIVASVAVTLVRGLQADAGTDRFLLAALGGSWVGYLVQSTVSIDVPTLLVLHFLLGGLISATARTGFRELRLPGARPAAASARRKGAQPSPSGGSVLIALATIVCLVCGWLALRPLRADLAAGDAVRRSNAGDAEAALDAAGRATDLASWQGRHWLIRTQVNERAQEVLAATDAAVVAAEREPGSSQYALLAARLVERYRTPGEAASFFRSALDRDPENPLVLAACAKYLAGREPKRALALAERARRIAPGISEPLLALGAIHRLAGRDAEARRAYATVRRMEPGNVEAAVALQELAGDPAAGT